MDTDTDATRNLTVTNPVVQEFHPRDDELMHPHQLRIQVADYQVVMETCNRIHDEGGDWNMESQIEIVGNRGIPLG